MPKQPRGDERSVAFVDAFNAASEEEQVEFICAVLEEDAEMRELFFARLRQRGVIA